jgi:anti-anti-sigma factor
MTADAAPLGSIAVVDEGGQPVIRLSGEIDTVVVAAYADDPSPPVHRSRPPSVIDASAVTFLDGRGLRFLVQAARLARSSGDQPVLRRPARVVRRLVDLTGAGPLFTITL